MRNPYPAPQTASRRPTFFLPTVSPVPAGTSPVAPETGFGGFPKPQKHHGGLNMTPRSASKAVPVTARVGPGFGNASFLSQSESEVTFQYLTLLFK